MIFFIQDQCFNSTFLPYISAILYAFHTHTHTLYPLIENRNIIWQGMTTHDSIVLLAEYSVICGVRIYFSTIMTIKMIHCTFRILHVLHTRPYLFPQRYSLYSSGLCWTHPRTHMMHNCYGHFLGLERKVIKNNNGHIIKVRIYKNM